jgi:hypothetical protein
MKKHEQTLTIIAILVLLVLIFLKVESDQRDRLEAAKIQMELSYQTLIESEVAINQIQSELTETKLKLDEWDDIDRRWLEWIRENWRLVKVVDSGQ